MLPSFLTIILSSCQQEYYGLLFRNPTKSSDYQEQPNEVYAFYCIVTGSGDLLHCTLATQQQNMVVSPVFESLKWLLYVYAYNQPKINNLEPYF